MTGFARSEGRHGDYAWVWEIKSVNHRGLDVRCRMPPGLDALEAQVRAAVGERFKRGAISVNLQIDRPAQAASLTINEQALDQVLALQEKLTGKIDPAPPRLDALLGVRGLVELVERDESEAERAERENLMLASLVDALAALAKSRASEGAKLAAALDGHIARIAELAEQSRRCAEAQPDQLRERLRRQVAELLDADAGLSEDRLAQEAALLAAKADVREEVDRLDAHVESARSLLEVGGVIGRQLDFLCQEFNREANTLCSKAADIELTRLGLDLKSAIDQMREQVQNVE